jgi:hypothetical protein
MASLGKHPTFLRPSCCQFICEGFPRPREQLVDPVDRVVGNARDDVAQVGFGIESVTLAGLDERIHFGGTNSSAVRTGEEIIFPAQDNRPIILPTSGRKLRSIIAGIRCMDAVSLVEAPTSADTVGLFTSK